MDHQLSFFTTTATRPFNFPFPSTRYQGSKRTLTEWIWEQVGQLSFDTVLDVFGGTGAVSHMFKNAGKQVVYNDYLAFNHLIGTALIENRTARLTNEEIDDLLDVASERDYPTFIRQTFQNIYFTDAENDWLDRIVYRIDHRLNDRYKRALAHFALFQACIAKRPYNLFHRANLYMRTAQVDRTFGNKTTWDTPFATHFRNFAIEANRAVFDNGRDNRALQGDALETPTGFDLVYLDPPYLNQKGIGVDYRDFYHFLEGISNYAAWNQDVDYRSKHRRLRPQPSVWHHPATIGAAFEALIDRHRQSVLVISYRDDGIPHKQMLTDMLKQVKEHVVSVSLPKQYVLSQAKSSEVLFIAT